MLQADLDSYFAAEKAESLLFMLVGAASFGLAAWLWWGTNGLRWAHGAVLPLVLIGLIQLVVGTTVYFRTDKQVQNLRAQYQRAPRQMAATELPRMQRVNRSFDLYKCIEIGLALAAVVLIAFQYGKPDNFWLGLGVALLLESLLMLGLDLAAENRADRYTAQLHALAQVK